MSFWGRLFGSDKATESLIEGAKSGIDKLWYTKEEKSDDRMKDVSEARLMVIEWLRNTQGQNLSRRLIALAITFTWLLLYLISAFLNVSSVWVESSQPFIDSANIIRLAANDMSGAVMLILGFYFAAPHMGRIAEVALTRFGHKNDTPSVPTNKT